MERVFRADVEETNINVVGNWRMPVLSPKVSIDTLKGTCSMM